MINQRKAGTITVRTAIVLIFVIILVAVGVSIFHLYHTFGKVREKTNESVLAVAALHVHEFYGGAREGDGYARHPEMGSFTASISSADVQQTLCSALGGEMSGNRILTKSFSITDLTTVYMNAAGGKLHFTTSLTVTATLRIFSGHKQITKDMVVRSTYEPKF